MKLKNKKLIRSVASANLFFTLAVLFVLLIFDVPQNSLDLKINDIFYKTSLNLGNGPEISDHVVYLTITDDSYKSIGSNYLDRSFLANVNNILADLGPNAVMYDIVFRLPSDPKKDDEFAKSLENAGMIFLPAGFKLTKEKTDFSWEDKAYRKLLNEQFLAKPVTEGVGEPFYAQNAVTQLEEFANAAYSTGHITTIPDEDGIYRHYPLVIKIDGKYLPTVSFAMYLDYVRVPIDSVIINWGNEIIIPKCQGSFMDEEQSIPIDNSGMTYIPFPGDWASISNKVEAHKLVEYYKNPEYYDELLDKFEGNFVVIGDVAAGISDLGQTPLETDVPLVIIHASLLNAFLTNHFYDELSSVWSYLIIIFFSVIFGSLSLLRSNKYLYTSGVVSSLLLLLISFYSVNNSIFVPVATIGISSMLIFFSQVAFLQVFGAREQAFIRNAFSKYVPQKVVEELIQNPDTLQLGGEEKNVSVLFSDIRSFTTISEKLEPKHLVSILNQYLTKMTEIILEQGGTVDKFIGDGIMAEFGAPIEYENHEDASVNAALKMQAELKKMNADFRKQGLAELITRIGINTGKVIIGNMGSDQVFDYTAIGDTINLASRLEGANKKYSTYLMISESTYQNLTPGKFKCRQLDFIRVKGKVQPVKVYEVYGFAGDEISDHMLNYYKLYDEAIFAFFNRQFNDARKLFDEALRHYPDDLASNLFLKRIAELDIKNLPEDWDGAVTFFDK